MREIRTSGSEGGGDEIIGSPYPYLTALSNIECAVFVWSGRPNLDDEWPAAPCVMRTTPSPSMKNGFAAAPFEFLS